MEKIPGLKMGMWEEGSWWRGLHEQKAGGGEAQGMLKVGELFRGSHEQGWRS